MRTLFLALAFVATPAAAADQFDLMCTAKKETTRFRVDLARGEYCADKCEVVQKISSVTSGVLMLSEHVKQFPRDHVSYNRVDRISGLWEWYYASPLSLGAQNIKGICEPAAFSGFPRAKF